MMELVMDAPLHVLKQAGGLQLCGIFALGSCTAICVQLHLIQLLPHLTRLGSKGSCRWVLAQLCFLVEPLDVIHWCKKPLCTQLFVYLLVFLIHICSRNHFLGSTASYHFLPHCALCANCLLYTMIFHVFSFLSVNLKAFPTSWKLSPKSQHSG